MKNLNVDLTDKFSLPFSTKRQFCYKGNWMRTILNRNGVLSKDCLFLSKRGGYLK